MARNPQHFQVKVFASAPWPEDLGGAIPVFHRWIRQAALPELLIDVADYRHVPAGPGILLVAHEAHYSLDMRRNRLGLQYTRRAALEGTTESKLRQAIDAALLACRKLESEPEFAGNLRFNTGEMEIRVNDRLLAPNIPETWEALRPALTSCLDDLWGLGSYGIQQAGDARELFTAHASVGRLQPA